MTSEDLYLQAITNFLPKVLLQNQLLIKAIEKPDMLRDALEQVFIFNSMPYPETEGNFKVEPIAEQQSDNRIFLITIPVAIQDIGGYPYALFVLAHESIRFFFVSINKIDYKYCLWELVGNNMKNCGLVKDKNDIINTVFELIR